MGRKKNSKKRSNNLSRNMSMDQTFIRKRKINSFDMGVKTVFSIHKILLMCFRKLLEIQRKKRFLARQKRQLL